MMKRKHNREDIISRGQEVLRERGYNNTGVDQILKATDLPKGSFYNFFNSKEDFAREVLNIYVSNQYEFISARLKDKSQPPLSRLSNFYKSMIEFNEGENCAKGCLLANMTQELAGISENISEDTDRHYNWITNLISDFIAQSSDF